MDGSLEKHRGAYPRLFRNYGYPNINFVGRVHEQISPSIIALQKIFLPSEIVIEHLGYNLSKEEMESKVRRNYKMLIAHVQEEPTNGYAWFQLGQTLARMGLNDEAQQATEFAISCGDLANSVYSSAAATLSQFYGRKKNYEQALHWAEVSLEKAPNQLFGLSLKAHSLLYLGRKQEAEEIFLLALEKENHSSQMPKSGFDIDISKETLLNGLSLSRKE
jgi:tetratricopeptide (TPR) repeat protein